MFDTYTHTVPAQLLMCVGIIPLLKSFLTLLCWIKELDHYNRAF